MKILLSILFYAVSTHAATLTCNFDGTPTSPCNFVSLSPITQINEPIDVPGAPFTPYTDSSPQALTITPTYGWNLQEFPSNLFTIYLNVQGVFVSDISMTELPTDAFSNCQNLHGVSFTTSVIGNIRAGFARGCNTMNSLSFDRCTIQSIDENAFEGLVALNSLVIIQSGLKCIPPRLFRPLSSIVMMSFSLNLITALHSETFVDLPTLSAASFDNNLITYVPNFNLLTTGTNHYGSSSFQLQLYDNPIEAISPLFLTTLFNSGRITSSLDMVMVAFHNNNNPGVKTTCVDPNLTSPTFNGNLFSLGTENYDHWMDQNVTYDTLTTCYSAFTPEMGSDSLVTCGNIATSTTTLPPTTLSDIIIPRQCASDKICRYYLDWNNQYTCVIDGAEGTVTSITGTHYLTYTNADVKRVYFINSHLSLVPKILFQTFPNLKFLHTANSGMTVINDQTFNECGVLELWDASDNDISRIDETSLRNCTNLRIIDLTGNPIDFVSQGLYQLDPALERIHLTRLDDWTLA